MHVRRSRDKWSPHDPTDCVSAAAERMRVLRQRRKEALRCLTIELRETEVDVLIRRGLLEADARNDRLAVMNSLHAHLEKSLGT